MSHHFENELDWSKERSLLLQRIELMQEQISEYNKREENNKKFSDTLITVVNDLSNEQARSREGDLQICNERLEQELVNMETRHQDIVQHYEAQVEDMKQEIRDMRKQRENLLVETERAKIAAEAKCRAAEEGLHQRDARIQKLERELQQQRQLRQRSQKDIEQLQHRYEELATEAADPQIEDERPTRRRESSLEAELQASHLSYTRQRPTGAQEWARVSPSRVSVDNGQNNMNSSNINQRRQRVQQFMKKDKQQLKLMVSTLLKAKGQLEAGGQNLSYIQERSTNRSSFGGGQSVNRTYFK